MRRWQEHCPSGLALQSQSVAQSVGARSVIVTCSLLTSGSKRATRVPPLQPQRLRSRRFGREGTGEGWGWGVGGVAGAARRRVCLALWCDGGVLLYLGKELRSSAEGCAERICE